MPAGTVRPMQKHPDHPSVWEAQSFSEPLSRLLSELAVVLARLTDEQYVRHPVGSFRSSIGAHVRHCLDHYRALIAAASTGELNYDNRERNTAIELDRHAAMVELASLRDRIGMLSTQAISRDVWLTTLLASDGKSVKVASSLGREVSFVISHTVHHNAVLAAMLNELGVESPARLGYAPATIQHEATLACVR